MGFYSFVVWAPAEEYLLEYRLVLDPGSNTFNLTVDDIDKFTDALTRVGVRIDRVNQLDVPADFDGLLGLQASSGIDPGTGVGVLPAGKGSHSGGPPFR